jgi:signal transduction histidine kinase
MTDTIEQRGPSIGRWRNTNETLTPAAVFLVQADGSYSYLTNYSTAILNTDDISQVLNVAIAANTSQDYLASESLYFAKRQISDTTLIAFADGAAANDWQDLAATLTLVGLGLIAAITIGSAFFARWALRPVQLAWDRQQQFIADASHELKTPLSVILANTAITLEAPDATVAEQSRWIESTQSQAIRMQTLVKEMLELAQADAASIKGGEGASGGFLQKLKKRKSSNSSVATPKTSEAFETSAVDFSDVVEGCTLSFEPIMYEAKVTLFTNIEPSIHVAGNQERLSRATYILLDNAAKYTTSGGIVDVKLSKRGHECTLSVTNTSEPLTDEQISRVFERFYQTDEARANTQSFGLGLAIAYEIATATGGKIQAKSMPELPGNTFAIILPCE